MCWNAPTSKTYRKKRDVSSRTSIFGGPSSVPRRRLQATEMYSKLYYKERILPVIQQRTRDVTETTAPMITIIREVTSELYANKDAETKAIVASKMAEAEALSVDPDDGADGLRRTARQFQE